MLIFQLKILLFFLQMDLQLQKYVLSKPDTDDFLSQELALKNLCRTLPYNQLQKFHQLLIQFLHFPFYDLAYLFQTSVKILNHFDREFYEAENRKKLKKQEEKDNEILNSCFLPFSKYDEPEIVLTEEQYLAEKEQKFIDKKDKFSTLVLNCPNYNNFNISIVRDQIIEKNSKRKEMASILINILSNVIRFYDILFQRSYNFRKIACKQVFVNFGERLLFLRHKNFVQEEMSKIYSKKENFEVDQFLLSFLFQLVWGILVILLPCLTLLD